MFNRIIDINRRVQAMPVPETAHSTNEHRTDLLLEYGWWLRQVGAPIGERFACQTLVNWYMIKTIFKE